MRFRVHRLAPVLVLGIALAALGCKPPPSKARFNNGIAEANIKLGQKGAAYRKALFPQTGKDFDPDKVDRSALQAAWKEMDSALRDVKEKYEDPDFVLPRRSPAAEALKSAYDEYLGVQSKVLELTKEIGEILDDPQLGRADKKRKVDDLLDDIRKAENDGYKKLTEAQRTLAETHHFRPVTKLD
jgi:hypothetical protein